MNVIEIRKLNGTVAELTEEELTEEVADILAEDGLRQASLRETGWNWTAVINGEHISIRVTEANYPQRKERMTQTNEIRETIEGMSDDTVLVWLDHFGLLNEHHTELGSIARLELEGYLTLNPQAADEVIND